MDAILANVVNKILEILVSHLKYEATGLRSTYQARVFILMASLQDCGKVSLQALGFVFVEVNAVKPMDQPTFFRQLRSKI
jgi:hypothetical protein